MADPGLNYDSVTDSGTDIVSFGLKTTGSGKNVGGATTAVIADWVCSDVGLGPTEANADGTEIVDTMTDCEDSSVAWGVTDPEDLDQGKLNAGFDNLILKLSTDASGTVLSANAYYTMEYPILGSPTQDNTWIGGTLNFSGEPCTDCEPPPATPVYAVTGASNSASTLYELDRDTATVIRAVGPTGFSSITAMDFHPLSGELYAIAKMFLHAVRWRATC